MLVWVAAAGCMAFAAMIGGASGFGSALVGTPLLLLVGLDVPTVVVVNLASALVTRVVVSIKLRAEMNRRRVALLCLGAVPGAVLGFLVLSRLPGHELRILAGVATILGGIWMAIPPKRDASIPGPAVQTLTGVLGGFLTTTTSLGGPPPVLLLHRSKAPPMTFIADLAGYFVVTSSIALALVVAGGLVPDTLTWQAVVVFVVAALIGNNIGVRIAGHIPTETFRKVVIGLILASGLAAIFF